MDEEFLKRNTDCVYFLASPFTCKKGAECDYRHSEMARLNPRDCWYWLSGSCLNPTCGFRHPPLDTHTKTPAEVEPLPNNSSFPPSKNNVPCYFYFNEYCNRGDKCPFLHGPEDISTSKQKDSVVVDAPPVDDRIPPDLSNQISPPKLLNDKLPTNVSNSKLLATTEPVLDAQDNNVSCYFCFNGYCNRGDKCPFLHGPEEIPTSKQKDFAVVDAPPVDNRIPSDLSNQIPPPKLLNDKLPTNVSNSKLPARTEPVLDAPENFPAALKRSVTVANEDPFPGKRLRGVSSILAQKDSSQRYGYEYEEASITKSDSLDQSDYVIESEPSMCSDQCSDENVDSGGRDVWLESSPGFDVLVKERTEGIEVADDQEYVHGYQHCYDRNDNFFIDHCYEDQKAYDGRRFLQEKRMHEPFYYSDYVDNHVRYSDGGRGANRILSQKRKLMNVGLTVGDDLREHLTKRRFLDEAYAERFAFTRCNLPLVTMERRERPQRRSSTSIFHGRLERNSFSLPMQKKTAFVAAKPRRQPWNSQLNNRRHHHRQQRQKFSSNVQRTEFSRRKTDNEVSFTRPKNLGRVKTQKSRVKADSTGFSGKSNFVDFEAPKPLSEILKKKKTVRSAD